MDDVSADKTRQRKRFRALRLALSDADYARRSAALCARLAALPSLHAAATVHVFHPLLDRREPDLRPLLARWQAEGKRLVLPHVVALDPPTMAHRRLDRLDTDAAGLPSADGPDVPLGEIDAVVVPALAVDRRGVRLGYGKGFYDRMLAGFSGVRVCPVFAEAFVDALPAGPLDVPVDVVVTDAGTCWVHGPSPHGVDPYCPDPLRET